MSLRDDLARRLTETFVASLKEPTVPSDFPSPTFYDMGAVADECLRQMEWARRKCALKTTGGEPILGHFSGQGEQQYGDIYVEIPNLTLAPPDWRAK